MRIYFLVTILYKYQDVVHDLSIYKRREEVRALLELAERLHCSTAGYCNLQPVMLCTHALSSGQYKEKVYIGVAMDQYPLLSNQRSKA